MKNRLIFYTNRNTEKSMWVYNDRILESQNEVAYETMTTPHFMLREGTADIDDLTHGIKMLLKIHGRKIK